MKYPQRRHTAPILQRSIYPEHNRKIYKRLQPPFPYEGWLWNSQELLRHNHYFHRDQDLQYSATKPHWNLKLRKFLGRTKMALGEVDSWHQKFWQSIEYWKVYEQKNLVATLLFVDFSKAFGSLHKGKMNQIHLFNCFLKETVAAIMILYNLFKKIYGRKWLYTAKCKKEKIPRKNHYRSRTRLMT